MAIDVLGNNVEVSADDHRYIFLFPGGHLVNQTIHPSQLVCEIDAPWGIPIREININGSRVSDGRFEKSRMTVCLIAGQDGIEGLDWETRDNRDAVIGFLRNGHAFVAQLLERANREFCPFQLLQQQDVRLVRVEPCGDMIESRAYRIYVPTCNFQDDTPIQLR